MKMAERVFVALTGSTHAAVVCLDPPNSKPMSTGFMPA